MGNGESIPVFVSTDTSDVGTPSCKNVFSDIEKYLCEIFRTSRNVAARCSEHQSMPRKGAELLANAPSDAFVRREENVNHKLVREALYDAGNQTR
jgi:hypothetical protein